MKINDLIRFMEERITRKREELAQLEHDLRCVRELHARYGDGGDAAEAAAGAEGPAVVGIEDVPGADAQAVPVETAPTRARPSSVPAGANAQAPVVRRGRPARAELERRTTETRERAKKLDGAEGPTEEDLAGLEEVATRRPQAPARAVKPGPGPTEGARPGGFRPAPTPARTVIAKRSGGTGMF